MIIIIIINKNIKCPATEVKRATVKSNVLPYRRKSQTSYSEVKCATVSEKIPLLLGGI